VAGNALTYEKFAAALSLCVGAAAGASAPVPLLSYEYPLAPEASIAEQVELGLGTYTWLARTLEAGAAAAGAASAPRIALVGDSAGGGIAALLAQRLAALQNLEEAPRSRVSDSGAPPPPSSLVLVSPALDIRADSASMHENARRDVMLAHSVFDFTIAALELNLKHTAPPRGLQAPEYSALHGSWAGLPPVYLWVAEAEALRDDTTRATAAIRAAGGEAEVVVALCAWHELPIWAHAVPEGAEAIASIARFVGSKVGQ